MEIKTSGKFREFSTGARRDIDESKGRMDLLPWEAVMEVSKHSAAGAAKYGEHNVDRGIPTHSLCDSAARHLAKYLSGWDDEPHLLAATWNLLWAVQMTITHPEVVDTPWRPEAPEAPRAEARFAGCSQCEYSSRTSTEYPCGECAHGTASGTAEHFTRRDSQSSCDGCLYTAESIDGPHCRQCMRASGWTTDRYTTEEVSE